MTTGQIILLVFLWEMLVIVLSKMAAIDEVFDYDEEGKAWHYWLGTHVVIAIMIGATYGFFKLWEFLG